MNKILVLYILLQFNCSFSQNLVLNGDFEYYDSCPSTFGNLNGYLQDVYNPHPSATTDYFNECDLNINPCVSFGHVGVPTNSHGFQEAQSGKGYIGLALLDFPNNYREYIVLPLSQTLEKDSCYIVSFYVSNPETFGKATNAIMISFTENAIPIDNTYNGILNLEGSLMSNTPIIDNKNWILLSKKHIAKGDENFLVIGNFQTYDEMYIVDGEYTPWVCSSIQQIGNPYSAYLYVDNVSIIKNNSFEFFPNVITPNDDGVNDLFSTFMVGYEILQGKIFNRWGNVVYEHSINSSFWNGKSNGNVCEDGIYFYYYQLKDIQNDEIVIKQGNITLIK